MKGKLSSMEDLRLEQHLDLSTSDESAKSGETFVSITVRLLLRIEQQPSPHCILRAGKWIMETKKFNST